MSEERLRTSVIGASVVSGIVAAPAAACAIALLAFLGVPAAGLEDLPVLMVLLWGVVVALILAGPAGLVLGGCVGWWIRASLLRGLPARSVTARAILGGAVLGGLYGAGLAGLRRIYGARLAELPWPALDARLLTVVGVVTGLACAAVVASVVGSDYRHVVERGAA